MNYSFWSANKQLINIRKTIFNGLILKTKSVVCNQKIHCHKVDNDKET